MAQRLKIGLIASSLDLCQRNPERGELLVGQGNRPALAVAHHRDHHAALVVAVDNGRGRVLVRGLGERQCFTAAGRGVEGGFGDVFASESRGRVCSRPGRAWVSRSHSPTGAPHHTEERMTMAASTTPESSTTLTDLTRDSLGRQRLGSMPATQANSGSALLFYSLEIEAIEFLLSEET
jgi:hypothetical protein